MRFKRAGSLFAAMAAAALLDRLSKAWAAAKLAGGADNMTARPIEIVPGVARLRYAENTGAAFSMFSDRGWPLIAVTALVLALIAFWLIAKRPGGLADWGLALVLAGGLSNLYDRIVYGYVVDFIEPTFVRFAVFNLADTWVCVGAALTLIGLWTKERRKKTP